MFNKTRLGLGFGLFSLLTVFPVSAQEVATLAMKNGERPSGELIDMNRSGFILRIGGQDRTFNADDVKAVEFVGGGVSAEAQAKINSGQPFVIMRSGQLIDGRLSDVGGTRPLRITLDTPSGSRDLTSDQIAQIWVNPIGAAAADEGRAVTPGAPAPIPANAIAVPANVDWTNTGIAVLRQRRLRFSATGDINLSPSASSGVGGSPAVTVAGRAYPLPGANAGALIGKVGNGAPFLIGGNTDTIQVRGTGTLMLGVNDDVLTDNSGSYYVNIASAN